MRHPHLSDGVRTALISALITPPQRLKGKWVAAAAGPHSRGATRESNGRSCLRLASKKRSCRTGFQWLHGTNVESLPTTVCSWQCALASVTYPVSGQRYSHYSPTDALRSAARLDVRTVLLGIPVRQLTLDTMTYYIPEPGPSRQANPLMNKSRASAGAGRRKRALEREGGREEEGGGRTDW